MATYQYTVMCGPSDRRYEFPDELREVCRGRAAEPVEVADGVWLIWWKAPPRRVRARRTELERGLESVAHRHRGALVRTKCRTLSLWNGSI